MLRLQIGLKVELRLAKTQTQKKNPFYQDTHSSAPLHQLSPTQCPFKSIVPSEWLLT